MSDEIPPWIDWHGGEHCPVAEGINGDIKFRDGDIFLDIPLADYHWEHGYPNPLNEIIAYRTRTP
jgi:hypothetical protein